MTFISQILQKFYRYSLSERIVIVYGILLLIFFIISPIVLISPINGANESSLYLIWKSTSQGWQFHTRFTVTALVIFLCLTIFLLRNTSFRFKNYLSTLLGTKNNDQLFNFGLLRMLTTNMFAIGETTLLLKSEFSDQISLSYGYYIYTSLFMIGLLITLGLALKEAKTIAGVNLLSTRKQKEHDLPSKDEIEGLFKGM